MHNRRPRWSLWAGALFLALSLAAGYAAADLSGDKKQPGKEPAKGKPGSACKIDTDCDQSSQPQQCIGSKCQVYQMPPPT